MSLQRWAALMGTGTTESNLFYPLTVVQHMPTGAGGGGKGRSSSSGKNKILKILKSFLILAKIFNIFCCIHYLHCIKFIAELTPLYPSTLYTHP